MPEAEPMNVMDRIFSSPCKYAALAKKSRKSGKKARGGRKTKKTVKRGKVTKKTARRGRKGKRSHTRRHRRRHQRGGIAASADWHAASGPIGDVIGAMEDLPEIFVKHTPVPHHSSVHTKSQPKRIPRK